MALSCERECEPEDGREDPLHLQPGLGFIAKGEGGPVMKKWGLQTNGLILLSSSPS
jgi:hypothetical protein